MSAITWDWSLASADGLLTTEECSMLLDVDLLNTEDDLLKSLPNAAPKVEANPEYHHEEMSSLYPPSPVEIKPTRSQLANDLLQQLENQCKPENIFSNWLEEKVVLPLFDNIGRVEVPPPSGPVAVAVPSVVQPPPTEELLREFETVYDAVELTHLTPPQSPPGPATQLLLSYAQQAGATVGWGSPAVDVERELREVDELVRRRADQLASPLTSPLPSSSEPSPPSSPRSTDDDWAPRSKPYSRHTDDRRSRKKEQNKNAATRYRQKKKAEVEVLLSEEHGLRQKHGDLSNKCSDLQREIRYLKSLMRDLFKAKGLIK